MEHTYFNPNGFQYKKDLPPVAVLAKKILEEKANQTSSESLKIQFERKRKEQKTDTMLAFSNNILPPADGCHPSITIGGQSNKIQRFDSLNPLRRDTNPSITDGETLLTMPSIDEDQENDGDGDHNYDTAPFGMEVDEDGTRHYTTADGKKNLFFKKNAPQNGKLLLSGM